MASIDLAPPLCATSSRASRPGQWLGEFSTAKPALVVAFLAADLSCAELCEASYQRSPLLLWPLAKH